VAAGGVRGDAVGEGAAAAVEAGRGGGHLGEVGAGGVEDVDHLVAGVDRVEIVGGLIDGDAEGAAHPSGRRSRRGEGAGRGGEAGELAVGGGGGIAEGGDEGARGVEFVDDGVGRVGDVDVAAGVIDRDGDVAGAEGAGRSGGAVPGGRRGVAGRGE